MTTFLKKMSQLDGSSLINSRSATWKILTTFLKNSEEASPKNRVYASFSQPEKSAILSYNHQTHPANVAPMRRDLWFSTSTIQPHFLSSVQPNFNTPMVFPGPCQHLEQASGLLSSMSLQSITCTCWQAPTSARAMAQCIFNKNKHLPSKNPQAGRIYSWNCARGYGAGCNVLILAEGRKCPSQWELAVGGNPIKRENLSSSSASASQTETKLKLKLNLKLKLKLKLQLSCSSAWNSNSNLLQVQSPLESWYRVKRGI